MTYVSWAALFEGSTDRLYFETLIPRVMEDITARHGTRTSTIPPNPAVILRRGTIDSVAASVCEAAEAFHILFIHADTGGRNHEHGLDDRSCAFCEAAHAKCAFHLSRCIIVSPRHETEAWILADPPAITAALGYSGTANSVGLPSDAKAAERLPDPKRALEDAVAQIRGRRRPLNVAQIFPAVAQRQSLASLRQSDSFVAFEKDLRVALADLGCVSAP